MKMGKGARWKADGGKERRLGEGESGCILPRPRRPRRGPVMHVDSRCTNVLTKYIHKNRPTTMVSIRIPEDVIEDLKRVAPLLGFSGYQALIKAYIGQGLRTDLERIEGTVEISTLIESLRRQGVKDEVISSAIVEAQKAE